MNSFKNKPGRQGSSSTKNKKNKSEKANSHMNIRLSKSLKSETIKAEKIENFSVDTLSMLFHGLKSFHHKKFKI